MVVSSVFLALGRIPPPLSTTSSISFASRARRWFSTAAATGAAAAPAAAPPPSTNFSPNAAAALRNIKDALGGGSPPQKKKTLQLSKKEKRLLQGNVGKYVKNHGRPEFHNIDRDRHGRVFNPTDTFQVVLTSSKNNLWACLLNKSREGRTVFSTHAGNVGIRRCERRTPNCTWRVGQNIARKCKRLGVTAVDVRFRKLMKCEVILQAFQAHGLRVTRLSHIPRLPKGEPHRAPKRRRV